MAQRPTAGSPQQDIFLVAAVACAGAPSGCVTVLCFDDWVHGRVPNPSSAWVSVYLAGLVSFHGTKADSLETAATLLSCGDSSKLQHSDADG